MCTYASVITVVTTDASPVGLPHMEHVALQEANQALDTVHEISQILDTGLDRETLNILIALCETGVNPEALAAVVRELRREAARLQPEQSKKNQQQELQ